MYFKIICQVKEASFLKSKCYMSLFQNAHICKLIYSAKKSDKCIMRSAGLDEAQAGIQMAGRHINPLRYAHDSTLTAEMKSRVGFQSRVRFRCSESFPLEVHATSYVYFPVLA